MSVIRFLEVRLPVEPPAPPNFPRRFAWTGIGLLGAAGLGLLWPIVPVLAGSSILAVAGLWLLVHAFLVRDGRGERDLPAAIALAPDGAPLPPPSRLRMRRRARPVRATSEEPAEPGSAASRAARRR